MTRMRRGQVSIEIPDNLPVLAAADPSGWWQASKTEGWFVYTLYESRRRVTPPLYVGVTQHLYRRLSAHRRSQAWWPLVGDITIEHFTEREDAYEAEDRRIYVMQPLFNTVCNIHTPKLEEMA